MKFELDNRDKPFGSVDGDKIYCGTQAYEYLKVSSQFHDDKYTANGYTVPVVVDKIIPDDQIILYGKEEDAPTRYVFEPEYLLPYFSNRPEKVENFEYPVHYNYDTKVYIPVKDNRHWWIKLFEWIKYKIHPLKLTFDGDSNSVAKWMWDWKTKIDECNKKE